MKLKSQKALLLGKQSSISASSGMPSSFEGGDGSMTVRWVPGRGLLLLYKFGNKWYSTKLDVKQDSSIIKPVRVPYRTPAKQGELGFRDNKFRIKTGPKKSRQIISVDKDGLADTTAYVKFKAESTTTPSIGSNDNLIVENITGDSRITLTSKTGGSKDSYINYHYYNAETANPRGWTVGLDSSDANTFKWIAYTSGNYINTTPSSTTPAAVMELTTAGNLDIDGTITAGAFGTTGYKRIVLDDAANTYTSQDGVALHVDTYAGPVDDYTSGTSTTASYNHVYFEAPTAVTATNSSVTTTDASTFTINGVPAATGNMTFTNAYAMRVMAGNIKFDSSVAFDCTNDIALSADGGNVTMDDGTTTIFDFDVDGVNLKIMDDANTSDYFNIAVGAEGATTLSTVDADTAVAHLTLDPDGDLIVSGADVKIDATKKLYLDGGGNTYIHEVSGDKMEFVVGNQIMFSMENALLDNTLAANAHFSIAEGKRFNLDGISGGEYLTSVDNDVLIYAGGSAQIEFTSEGTVLFQNDYTFDVSADNTLDVLDSGASVFKIQTASISIPATNKLYFDGGNDTYIEESSADVMDFYVGAQKMMTLTEAADDSIQTYVDIFSIEAEAKFYLDGAGDTYIQETSADVVRHYVGGDIMMQLSEKGADGNEVSFGESCVGFTQLEPVYDAVATNIDFRHSNKQFLTFGSGNIGHLVFYFPLVSGNFQLLIKQDGTGSRTITGAYKVYEFDESTADGVATVVWAGGSAPTLTTDANHVDILSFYWDADNEIAYGVATLDFQF